MSLPAVLNERKQRCEANITARLSAVLGSNTKRRLVLGALLASGVVVSPWLLQTFLYLAISQTLSALTFEGNVNVRMASQVAFFPPRLEFTDLNVVASAGEGRLELATTSGRLFAHWTPSSPNEVALSLDLDRAEISSTEAPSWASGLHGAPEPSDPTPRPRVLGLLPTVDRITLRNATVTAISSNGRKDITEIRELSLNKARSLAPALGLRRFNASGVVAGFERTDMVGSLGGEVIVADGFARLKPVTLHCPNEDVPLGVVVLQLVPPFGFAMNPFKSCSSRDAS